MRKNEEKKRKLRNKDIIEKERKKVEVSAKYK